MYCTKCQINLEPNAKFCTDCGEPAISSGDTKSIMMDTNQPDDFKKKLNTSDAYKTSENKISNPKPYVYMLYGGLVFSVTFALMGLAAGNTEFFIVSAIGLWAILLAQIYIYVFIYQFWRFVINEGKKVGLSFEVETPGKAVGYLFIPFYNIFVWTFKVFRDFPKAFNELSRANKSQIMMTGDWVANIPVYILLSLIPFVNIFSSITLGFISYPQFVKQGVECINRFKKEEEAR